MITPQQIRGARALVGLTQAALAKRAGLSTTGLNNIERGVADPKASTLRAIQSALEAAGVESRYVELISSHGHDGFLADVADLAPLLVDALHEDLLPSTLSTGQRGARSR